MIRCESPKHDTFRSNFGITYRMVAKSLMLTLEAEVLTSDLAARVENILFYIK